MVSGFKLILIYRIKCLRMPDIYCSCMTQQKGNHYLIIPTQLSTSNLEQSDRSKAYIEKTAFIVR